MTMSPGGASPNGAEAAALRAEMVRLQHLLLPPDLPVVHCTEAAAAYRPHNHDLHVGGDWYDLIDLHDRNEVVAIVGDVVGHGLEQIGVMGQLRAASNALARVCSEPHELLGALDGFARGLAGAEMTTTMVLTLDGTRTARLAAAGHPPLLHLKTDGTHDVVMGGRRPPLTLNGASEAPAFGFRFDLNDLLVLVTDGVVERRDRGLDEGFAELADFVRANFDQPCRDIAEAIVDDFAGGAIDDIAVMVLRPLHQRDDDYRLSIPIPPTVSIRE